MKTDYIDGITTVKHFLDNIDLLSAGKINKIDLGFYKNNYEKLLFYISKSFLSDNYDDLFSKLDPEVSDAFFNDKTFLNPDTDTYSPISIYLSEQKYCKMPDRFHMDPMNAYKVIVRNALCHYAYRMKGNRIIVNNVNFDEGAEISIASIVGLLKYTLSSYGMSTKKGAYDYFYLLSPVEGQSRMILIKNLEDNQQAPTMIVEYLVHFLDKEGLRREVQSPKVFIDFLKRIVANFGNYYIREFSFRPDIMKKAGIFRVSSRKELDLYMCAHDEIKRAGIAYNMLLDLIFRLRDGEIASLYEDYDSFYPILSNTVFISYMSLVFDDLFARNFDGTINSGLFVERPSIKDKDIPWKFRNSLAHSRYRFENIFDSSMGIVIEFWDEKDGIKNFECKITRENAIALIDDFLAQISK